MTYRIMQENAPILKRTCRTPTEVFFEIQNRRRKRTKKEIRQAKIAKNRCLAHKLIIGKCGCRRNCDHIVSKGECAITHNQFWKLDKAGQIKFIRENVQRNSQPLRRKNRFTTNEPKKRCSCIFSIHLLDGTDVRVCRKMFLNTIDYGDNCGLWVSYGYSSEKI